MMKIFISDLTPSEGRVEVSGWVENIRKQSKVIFIVLRDTSDKIQVVVGSEDKQLFDAVSALTLESVVKVTGTVVEQKQVFGGREIQAHKVEVLSQAEPQLPIPVLEKGQEEVKLDKRLDYRWIDLRKDRNLLLFQIYTSMLRYMREFFYENRFIEAVTPKMMASPSESNAELFEVSYFDKKAYMAQSAQFYKQMAMASGFERFFTFGDTYRADPSSTVWHITQFTTLDVEISFIDSEKDVYQFEEELLRYSIGRLKEEYGKKIKEVFGVSLDLPEGPFPTVTMEKANEIVKKMGSSSNVLDLTTPEEKLIGKWAKEEFGSDFIFVVDWPWEARPFYHMKKAGGLTRGADLLYKGRELSTDAQREHRYDVLVSQVKEKGLKQSKLQHYLDFFRYGCPPHGGFGFGYERFLKQLLGLSNIRESMYLPRDMKRLTP
jgi:aspartyl-tRNA synthetase